MTFTPEQIALLKAPLDPKNVRPPAPGKYGEYIDAHHVISEANRIFGFDGWSYVVTSLELCCRVECVDRNDNAQIRVAYRCTVRATAGDVTREGAAVGTGIGKPENEGDTHESAVKEAETDALKRALRSFGNPFGLALYDKSDARQVSAPPIEMFTDAMRDEIAMMAQGTGVPLGTLIGKFNEGNGANAASLKDLPATEFEPMKKGLQAIMEKRAAKQKEAA